MRRPDISPSGAALASLLALIASPASAFYFPGTAPASYKEGDAVPLYVNHLTPADSQYDPKLRSVFSFDYYHEPFRFCKPEGGPKEIRESLGSILFGDRIQTSPFELRMGKNETCKALCEATYDPQDAVFVNKRVYQGYDLNWLIDGLPAAQLLKDPNTEEPFYSPGFALGQIGDDSPEFNNHYDIVIDYHEASANNYRVVGVLVDPYSLRDVYWRLSPTPFATRWDNYLHVYDPKIHWFSLVNSAVIVVFLVAMVSTILVRTLKKDIARYNRLDQFALEDFGENGDVEDGVAEDSGWKLVHGDVFRTPKYPLLLSVLVGNGFQLFAMTAVTIGESANRHLESSRLISNQPSPSLDFSLLAIAALSVLSLSCSTRSSAPSVAMPLPEPTSSSMVRPGRSCSLPHPSLSLVWSSQPFSSSTCSFGVEVLPALFHLLPCWSSLSYGSSSRCH
jgi:transmembrane 9 superfamily protein 2/4